MACGCKGAGQGQVTKYEVNTNTNGTVIVDDLPAARVALAKGGGGTWKAVTVKST